MSRLLHTAISERASARPEALAIPSQYGSLTYGELEASSNRQRLAWMLELCGCHSVLALGMQ
jgi:non-ribosomal peptide synthetase component F